MKTQDYVTEHIAGRLLGVDPAIISRRAANGDYGETIKQNGRLYISMRALQRKARRVFLFDPADPISPLDYVKEK